MVDPVVAWVARLALALVFGAAAAHKWRAPDAFAAALAAHHLLPDAWVPRAARALALTETAIAVALLVPPLAAVAATAAAAVLVLYSSAIATNLARGRRDIDCGCSWRPRPLSRWLLVRNAALAAGAFPAAAPVLQRELSWLDAVTAVASLAALALVGAAADSLAAARAASRVGRSA